MKILSITVFFLWAVPVGFLAAEPVNQIIFGSNPVLSAGVDALSVGDYEEGLRLTQDGLNSELKVRDRANAFNNMCAGYLGLEQFTEALEYCDQALELNNQNWRIFNNRALALLGTGRVAAARDDVIKGLALNPDSTTLAKVAKLVDEQVRSRLLIVGHDKSESFTGRTGQGLTG